MSKSESAFASAEQELYAHLANDVLFEASRNGNRAAFGELFSRHLVRLRRTISTKIRSTQDVDEIIQNSSILAFTKIAQCRDARSFPAWLSRIAQNQCSSYVRAQRRFTSALDSDSFLVSSVTCTGYHSCSTPEDIVANDQLHNLISREIARVPLGLRQVLILSDVHSMSMSEVGDQLGLELGVVKSRLFRARRLVRSRLERHMTSRGAAGFTADVLLLSRGLQSRVTSPSHEVQ